jgi:hypothetical protein
MNLIKKLSPLQSKGSWLDRKEDMGKSILRQIVNEKTRISVAMEETKMIRAGASLTLSQMIKHAFDGKRWDVRLDYVRQFKTDYVRRLEGLVFEKKNFIYQLA